MRWRRRGTEGAYAWRGGLVGLTRVELVTSSLSGTRSNQLSYKPSWSWWRQPDSDRRHPACKAGALPAEPCPRQGARPGIPPEGARNTAKKPCESSNFGPFGPSPQKGGDPTAGSPTVTLLRLHPNHHPHLRPTNAGLRVQTAFMM